MNKLEEICAAKREVVAARKAAITREMLERAAATQTAPRGFETALRARVETGFALIAEIKKASPSKGLIRADFRPAEHAAAHGHVRPAEEDRRALEGGPREVDAEGVHRFAPA